MSWAVGYDTNWRRDIGYGVPATCDHPGCGEGIDRGLYFVCCGEEPRGGEHGCGLYFCGQHLRYGDDDLPARCERCQAGADPFAPTPDVPEWINHKLTDPSWQRWRDEHPDEVAALDERVWPDAEIAGDAADRSGGTVYELREVDGRG
ncbi:hypothetical protein IU469_22130 [Nocardia puris]|uniref:hypothetical protein n=1 Tax=Nocardia puris TaxID=208602 RepID=UPI0018936320|nr:hypothetical protein [Nocardia puris]MBF6368398.1 hypothetical protein [Nocardia puris]